MTDRVAERLGRCLPLRRADLAVRLDGRGRVRYHLARAARHLAAMGILARGRNRYGVAYISLPGGYALAYMTPIVAVARLLSYEVVFHHHSFRYIDRRVHLFELMLRAAGGHEHHLFLCERMRDRFKMTYGLAATSSHVVSNAWSIDPVLSSSRARDSGRLVLGHLSNLTTEKGLDKVLKAFDILAADDSHVELHLAGPSVGPGAEGLVTEAMRRHPGRILYIGPVAGAMKQEFLANVDIFVFPSRHEAEPLVIDEALAAGCSVIVTGRGCICDQNYGPPATRVLGPDPTAREIADATRTWRRSGRDVSIAAAERRRQAGEEQMERLESWLVRR